MAIGVSVQPFRLKEDLPERHDELRAIFKRLGDTPLRYGDDGSAGDRGNLR
jgi:hypothetical protein